MAKKNFVYTYRENNASPYNKYHIAVYEIKKNKPVFVGDTEGSRGSWKGERGEVKDLIFKKTKTKKEDIINLYDI